MTPTVPHSPIPTDQLDDATVAAGLDRAAALIEADGLIHGEFWDLAILVAEWAPGKSCCTVGAIAVAHGYRFAWHIDRLVIGVDGNGETGPVHPALLALMRYLGFTDPIDVMNWSDQSRDREVIDTLRAAAAALRIRVAVEADELLVEQARAHRHAVPA